MLTTRIVMSSSAAVLAVAGFACLFVPAEVATASGFSGAETVPVQLLSALYLGLAAANWTARGSMIGGIYARPLALANFMHWVIGATVLIRHTFSAGFAVPFVVVASVYAAFAVLFALMLYGRLPAAGPPED